MDGVIYDVINNMECVCMIGVIHVVGNGVEIICMPDAIKSSVKNVESLHG